MHEFGNQLDVSVTTRAIVMRGIELSKKFGIPIICQYPGNFVAEENQIKPWYVVRMHKKILGGYLDTEEVNRQAALVCNHRGWTKAIVVAQPDHLWRAILNMKRQRIEAFFPETRDIPYDPDLDRFWLKAPERFIPYEIVARLVYLIRGLI
jgi:hypothetical protein